MRALLAYGGRKEKKKTNRVCLPAYRWWRAPPSSSLGGGEGRGREGKPAMTADETRTKQRNAEGDPANGRPGDSGVNNFKRHRGKRGKKKKKKTARHVRNLPFFFCFRSGKDEAPPPTICCWEGGGGKEEEGFDFFFVCFAFFFFSFSRCVLFWGSNVVVIYLHVRTSEWMDGVGRECK